jgi:hypothetical protein
MKTKNFPFAVLGLILMMFPLNACAANKAQIPIPATSTMTLMILATETPVSTSTLAPTASFTSPAPTYTPGGPFPVGTYEPMKVLYINKLEFHEDGTFRYTLDSQSGGGSVSGTYVLNGNEIVLNEAQTGPCAGFPGTYSWGFDGSVLFLKAIEDKCPLPHKLPLQRGWVKQS